MTTYRADVLYIKRFEPNLIETNSAEFRRMSDLIDSVEPDLKRAGDIEWESVTREQYDSRVKEALSILQDLSSSFRRSNSAIFQYALAVAEAKSHIITGMQASSKLGEIMQKIARGQSDAISDLGAEPMRQFDSISSSARSTVNGEWLEEATRAYEQADMAFYRAISIEQPAREDCLAKLRSAYASLPDFHSGSFPAARTMIAQLGSLNAEIAQAGLDSNVALRGAGVKDEIWPTDPDKAVSDKLANIRAMANSASPDGTLVNGEMDWISKNKTLINEIAAQSGLPPDMLAAILLAEDDRGFIDSIVWGARELGMGNDPDKTSFGPMQIQIATAADVLGYDVDNLTDAQREEIDEVLKDDVQSLYVGAEYLERMKASSDFAHVPADQMTPEQYRLLAQRYNGGLEQWNLDGAKEYGREFDFYLGLARQALR